MSGRIGVLVVAATAVVIAAGCGSGDSGGDSAPEVTESSLTKAQFVKQANKLCAKERSSSVTELTTFASQHEKKGLPEGSLLEDMVREVILPRIERETNSVAELGAPAGQQKQVEAFVDAQSEETKEVAGNDDLKSLKQVEASFAKSGAIARSYGIVACANS